MKLFNISIVAENSCFIDYRWCWSVVASRIGLDVVLKGILVTLKLSTSGSGLLSMGLSANHRNLNASRPSGTTLICRKAFSTSVTSAASYRRKFRSNCTRSGCKFGPLSRLSLRDLAVALCDEASKTILSLVVALPFRSTG